MQLKIDLFNTQVYTKIQWIQENPQLTILICTDKLQTKAHRVFGWGEVNTDNLFAVQQILFLQTRF